LTLINLLSFKPIYSLNARNNLSFFSLKTQKIDQRQLLFPFNDN